jgi:hypothetical protein
MQSDYENLKEMLSHVGKKYEDISFSDGVIISWQDKSVLVSFRFNIKGILVRQITTIIDE